MFGSGGLKWYVHLPFSNSLPSTQLLVFLSGSPKCPLGALVVPWIKDMFRCVRTTQLTPFLRGDWPAPFSGANPAIYIYIYLGDGFFFFKFHPYLWKISNLTNIFQMGWNHQLDIYIYIWVIWALGFFGGWVGVFSPCCFNQPLVRWKTRAFGVLQPPLDAKLGLKLN